ncbi:MAG: hypothetical protein EA350_03830 [Gemmatimonadales bacterium]|nr:MAG: hypothetical protein EA350_03830 [Gemmatimonadales bacterium]
MHQMLTGEQVGEPRHYVGLRVEQGVPVLDADLNEAADIERVAARLQLDRFFGDGIPFQNEGFRITAIEQHNDFVIRPGVALVGGMLVVNPHLNLRYTQQGDAHGTAVPDLVPPEEDPRTDLVYLDVWEEEVAASGHPRADARLMDARIGMETARRIERRWAVRVAPATHAIEDVPVPPGHRTMALARLNRSADGRIRSTMIVDERRTDLNVARYLKVPLRAARGGTTIDSRSFADLYDNLRRILTGRIAREILFLPAADHERTVVLLAAQHLLQHSSTIALQSRTHNLNREDAVEACRAATEGQEELLDAIEEHSAGIPGVNTFLTRYRTRLDPLRTRVEDGDLVGAYEAQSTINSWLAIPLSDLPGGSVVAAFREVVPETALAHGVMAVFTMEVNNQLAGNAHDEEIFDLSVEQSSGLWTIGEFDAEIAVERNGSATFTLEVVPHSADPSCVLTVTAVSRRNPAIRSAPRITLQIGALPPVGRTLAYPGSFNDDGRINLRVGQLSGPGGRIIPLTLSNRSTEPADYEIEWFVELPDDADTDDWPIDETDRRGRQFFTALDPGVNHEVISLRGPAGTVGIEGELVLLLTDPEEELRLPFVVID